MARFTSKQIKEIQETKKLQNNLHTDRNKQEIELIKAYIWEKTKPTDCVKQEINNERLRLSELTHEEFKEEYWNICSSYLDDFWEHCENKSEVETIGRSLEKLNSSELEYLRLKIIQNTFIPGYEIYKKNIHYRSAETLKVMELLNETEISEFYPEFKDVFNSEEFRKKCFNENYVDKYVWATIGSANFKAFIDELFCLYLQLKELDESNAEKAFIDAINSALNMHEPCLLICCTKRHNNISIKAVFFAKNDAFKFHVLNNNSLKIKLNENTYFINSGHKNYEPADKIQRLIKEIYEYKKISKYKNFSKTLSGFLIQNRILRKKSNNDSLCNVCDKYPSDKHYKNKSTCAICHENIESLVQNSDKPIKIQSIHKALKHKKDESFEKWRKRQHRYIRRISNGYSDWIKTHLS